MDKTTLPAIRSAIFVTACYAVFAGLWILLSDQAVYLIAVTPEQVSFMQTWKGWFFILVTAFLLFLALKSLLLKRDKALAGERTLRRHLQLAQEAGAMALFSCDINTMTVQLHARNPMFSLDPENPGSTLPLDSVIHPSDLHLVRQSLEQHLSGKTPVFSVEFRIRPRTDTFRWVLGYGTLSLSSNDSAAGTVLTGSLLDIHDRKTAEESLNAANRALKTLSLCQDAITRAMDESEMMSTVCRNIVEQGGYRMAWVGMAEDDEERTVRPVAHWGVASKYLRNIFVSWGENQYGRGPTGKAIRSCKSSSVRDIHTDPEFAPWRDKAMTFDFASSLALPLAEEGKVFGALTIYAEEPDAFEPAKVELLNKLAKELAFGLQSLRARELASKAENSLRLAEARFRATFEQAAVGICHITPEAEFTLVNAPLCAMLGYSRDELRGRLYHEFTHPNDRMEWQTLSNRLMQGDLPFISREKRCLRRDGSEIWIQETLSTARPDQGAPYFVAMIEDITPRKNAENQIRQSRHEMSTLADNIPDLVARYDKDLRLVFVNRALCQSTGMSKEFYQGKSNKDLDLPIEMITRFDAALSHVLETGTETSIQFPFTIVQGERILQSRIAPEFDLAGDLKYLVAVIRDITDIIRAETALRQSERRLNEAQRIAKMANIEHDMIENRFFWSDEMFRLLGYAPNEVQASFETFLRHIHPDDRERVARYHEQVLTNRNEFAIEFRYTRTNRQERHGFLTGRVTRGAGDKAVSYLGVFHDITERKRTEEEASLLATAIEQVGESVTITDEQGVILYVNPAFERVSGFKRVEVQGRTPRILKSGVHDQEFYRELWATITHGQVWRGRIINKSKDGRLHEVEEYIYPVRNGVGAITHFVALKHDVTDRLRMERQLRQAQKMEAIGTLAGGIAHDFNNILAAIMGFAEIALMETPGELQSVRESLEDILTGSRRGAELVRNILTFSKQSVQEKTPLPPQPLVKEALKLLRASLPMNVEIHQFLDMDNAMIFGTPSEIQQLVINLCTNASQALQPGGGEIHVSLERHTPDAEELAGHSDLKPRPHMRLTVRDNGPGISPEIMDRVFDPFFTTKSPAEGTGLGLSIVHGVALGLNGAVILDSAPNHGAIVHVLIPLTGSMPAPDPGSSEVLHGSQHVLLVDDEEPVARSMERMLSLLGYHVSAFTSALQALEAFTDSPGEFDLVISDQTMPGLSGVELAERVHNLRPELPILIISGNPGQLQAVTPLNIGIRGVLTKPLELRDLSKTLHSILNMEHGSEA